MGGEKKVGLDELHLHERKSALGLDAVDPGVGPGLSDLCRGRSRALQDFGRRRKIENLAAEFGLHTEVAGRGTLQHRMAQGAGEEDERPFSSLRDLGKKRLHEDISF